MIDEVRVSMKGGTGGKGCRSFYRDKYTRIRGKSKGVPDGGDGGRGADIIIQADKNVTSLLDYRYKRVYIADNGAHGSGNRRNGKGAKDLKLLVPVGTLIKDEDTSCLLKDLDKDKGFVIVVKGGRGGLGNSHRTEAKLSPKEGESRNLLLELKIIADVGIVGFPNAGKSTLVSSITKANSRIGKYHFTTLSPVLGVVKSDDFSFTLADIPGLIEGSHSGKGLGYRFLKHIERNKIILHLVDMSASEGRSPIEDYKRLNRELIFYSKELANKPQFIVANKMDLESAQKNLKIFKSQIHKKVIAISALEKKGLEYLIDELAKKIQKISY
ncbi:MAG: GTPase ObgE [Candidatus Gygaella obscura]|nr:GTPase ObgE [Candidatus Gygaella obscura]